MATMHSSHSRRALVLLCLGCGHAPPKEASRDVLSVTELAARYALEHEVPAVLREGTVVCLEVDGLPPASEVLAGLGSGPVQVSSGGSACSGPRAVLLQVSVVEVSGETAVARAGVRLGPSAVVHFRRAGGEWRLVHP